MQEPRQQQDIDLEDDWFDPREEEIARFYEQGDLAKLITYLKAELEKCPRSRMIQQELVDAFNRRGQPDKARALLEPLYRNNPSDGWCQQAMLDVLLVQGLPWDAFDWQVVPDICHIDSEMIEVCAALMASNGGWIHLYELFELLPMEVDAFLFFTVDQLGLALHRTGRFVLDFSGEGSDIPVFLVEPTAPEAGAEDDA